MNKKKFHLAGEVALLIVLLINSLGVDLMSKKRIRDLNDLLSAACI